MFFFVLVTAIPGLILLWLAYLGWMRRYTPGNRHFLVLVIALAIWSLAYALELASRDLATILTWEKLKYAGVVVTPVAWLTFAARYTSHDRWVNWRTTTALMIVPALTLIFAWTNEFHHLMWRDVTLREAGPVMGFHATPSVWTGIHILYSYSLVLVGTLLLLRSVRRVFVQYRQRSIALLLAIIIAIVGNLLTLFGVVPDLDLTPPFFAVSAIIIALALLRFGLLDMVPIAYDAVMSYLPDGVCVVDTDGTILAVNPALCDTLGQPAEKLIGASLKNVIDRDPPPSTSKGDITDTLEVHIGEQYTDLKIAPLRDPWNNVRGYVYIFRDVTNLKRTELELNKRVQQLTTVRQIYDETGGTLEMQEVEIISLDAAMRLTGADAGYIAIKIEDQLVIGEAVGRYHLDLFTREDLPNKGIVARVRDTMQPELILDVRTDPDCVAHLENTVAQMVIPLVTQEQQLIGVLNLETPRPERFTQDVFEFLQTLAGHLAIVLDNAHLHKQTAEHLTEMRDVYHRLRRLEQLKTDMIRIAAHDLGNPLTAIKSRLDMLLELDRESFDKTQVEDLEVMQNAANRMRGMINNFLSLERIEQMAKFEDLQLFDMTEQVERAVSEYQVQARSKSQTLELIGSDHGVMMVEGDVSQLYEAMSNLISNAIKYTPSSGRIEVTLKREDDRVLFEVTDTGYGIPEDQQERLFQPFYRAKTTETETIAGTGLGLHLVKNIVRRHGGEMIFHSVYGQGSTFGFSLPAVHIPEHSRHDGESIKIQSPNLDP